MNQISFAKLFLVVSIATVVMSTIDAAPESNTLRRIQRIVKQETKDEEPDVFACPCPRMRWQVCNADR